MKAKPLKAKPLKKVSLPADPRGLALYRARLSCSVGKKGITGDVTPPPGATGMEWAMFNLMEAIEDIVEAMEDERAGE